MLYLVYKTTNLVNGKFYIGCHQTNNRDDGYMGSGTLLKRAIQKYGEGNFKREILFEALTPQEMFEKEKELVVVGPESYNLKRGGEGGFDFLNSPEGIKKREWTFDKWRRAGTAEASRTFAKRYREDLKFKDKIKRAASLGGKVSSGFRGKSHSEETKRKMSEGAKGRIPWNKGKKIKDQDTPS